MGKKTTWVVVALAIVAAVAMLAMYVSASSRAAAAEARVEMAEAQMAQLVAQLSAHADTISQIEKALAQSNQAAAEREKWFQAQLASLGTATPVQLVDAGSEILGASDIVTDGKVVTMSVETYRVAVVKLTDHREYVNVREPAWAEREGLYIREISEFKSADIIQAKQMSLQEAVIKDLREIIYRRKAVGTFEKIAWAGVGFAAGSLYSAVR